jgi:hypothetical protein
MKLRGLIEILIWLSIHHACKALKINLISQNATSVDSVKHLLAPGDLVFDFGFYNGMDSWAYLSAGLKVVAIEADVSLVQLAQQNANFAPYLQSGQLTLLNVAIAPPGQNTESSLPFYLNKCTKEWNSFLAAIGCRHCTPPHPQDPNFCVVHNLVATPCAQVLRKFGSPKYMKIDIEGAEGSCYDALGAMPVSGRPVYISGEVGDDKLVDVFANLGFTGFKLVRQSSGHSGGWAEEVPDCRTGKLWRSVDGARQELQQIFKKLPNPADPCPGQAVGGVWYDLHAARVPHQTW